MSDTTITTKSTVEPVKRILRTVVALVIGAASVVPWVIGMIQGQVATSDGLAIIFTQAGTVSTAVTAFAASPAGNYIFGLIGLDAGKVEKVTGAVTVAVQDAGNGVVAAVDAAKQVHSDVSAVVDAANDVAVDAEVKPQD